MSMINEPAASCVGEERRGAAGGTSKVVELDALKIVTLEGTLCQSTAFQDSFVNVGSEAVQVFAGDLADKERPQSALSEGISSEGMSEKEASLTSVSTASSIDMEEHRGLTQSVLFISHDSYSSFCSTCSNSCSTLEGDSSYESSFTTDSESSSWEDYSDDDGHLNLIQPPISEDHLEFWPLSGDDGDDDNTSDQEVEGRLGWSKEEKREYREEQEFCVEEEEKEGEEGQEFFMDEENGEDEEEQKFCVQCHTWPEVEDCRST